MPDRAQASRFLAAEQAATARGNHIGLHIEEIGGFQYRPQQDERRDHHQQQVFLFDQGIVVAQIVGMVQNQPQSGQQEIEDFQHQGGITKSIDVQRARRAHGPDKQGGQAVGGEHKQKQGEQLQTKGITQQG